MAVGCEWGNRELLQWVQISERPSVGRPDTCQISTANARLFRYNLAEVSHPTDINILIRVTIYSNNLTILTHAEQMGWGRGPARELVGGEGALAETGWPAGRSRGEGKGLLAPSCQQIGSWNDPRFPLPGQPTYTLMSQTAGGVREILNRGSHSFIHSSLWRIC